MKKLSLKIICMLAAIFALSVACRNIPQENRLIEVEEEAKEGTRTVLLEDFTGVHCVNCPNAAKAVHDILSLYGKNVVAVGLHGAENFTPKDDPLFSADAEQYYLKFAPQQGLPAGMLNRKKLGNNSYIMDSYSVWAANVKKEIALPQLLKIKAEATAEGSNGVHAKISVEPVDEKGLPSDLMLQVWVIENHIMHIQDGAKDPNNYEHNHVLRFSLNGTWGEKLEWGRTYEYSGKNRRISEIENCQLVTFVYDAGTMEVLEANLVDIK